MRYPVGSADSENLCRFREFLRSPSGDDPGQTTCRRNLSLEIRTEIHQNDPDEYALFFQGEKQVKSHNARAMPSCKTAKMAEAKALGEAKAAEAAAMEAEFQDHALNETAEARIDAWHRGGLK